MSRTWIMLKRLVFLVLLLGTSLMSFAQDSPYKWTWSAKKTGELSYEIRFSCTLHSPWHIYSQYTPAGGPLATNFRFRANPMFTYIGKLTEVGTRQKKYEEVFGIDVLYFDSIVDFVQIVKLKKKVNTNLAGSVEFMLCNDQQCLPPALVNFSVELQ